MNKNLILVADNIRSAQNVGSLFRTAECLGVKMIYLCGYTPYPTEENDSRLPHIARKNEYLISKTALGANSYIKWSHFDNIQLLIEKLKKDGFFIIALEQSSKSILLNELKIKHSKIALIVGNELKGVSEDVLNLADTISEIKMEGKKESLNVVQAAAIAIYAILNI